MSHIRTRLEMENTILKEALKIIKVAELEQTEGGQGHKAAREFLDKHNVYHGDLQGGMYANYLLAEVAKTALEYIDKKIGPISETGNCVMVHKVMWEQIKTELQKRRMAGGLAKIVIHRIKDDMTLDNLKRIRDYCNSAMDSDWWNDL